MLPAGSEAQPERSLDENCTVSILNRTARVKPDGSWTIGNVPATGRARIRAVCRHGDTNVGGHSDFIEMTPFQFNGFDANFDLSDSVPIADGMTISLTTTILSEIGEQMQLDVAADLPDGGIRNVTAAETGTNYSSSNAAVATVSEDGLVTAVMSGVVMISAANEGSLAIVRIIVAFGGDSDGDGISDSLEVLLGMDPDNPADALEDFDFDGLTNAEEVVLGTDIENADTDFDGLADGDEIDTGTNPLDADSDDDGLLDGLETNPTDDDDSDGLINALDPDRDNDGLSDGVETAISGNPTDAAPGTDSDSDGLTNIDEVSRGTDPADRDSDNDGLYDGAEVRGGCNPLIFDAPTIVIGRIIDESDTPIAGALVDCYAERITDRVETRSNDDGTFQLPGTTVCGGVQVGGRAFFDGRELQGASTPVAALAGDLTDIGDVVLRDQPGEQFPLPRFATAQDSNVDFRHLLEDDFNGDGVLDLVGWRMDLGSNRLPADEVLTVLLGRSDGSFASGFVTRLAERTVDFLDNRDDFDNVDWATGDFNDDGHLDLVFTWKFESKATILPGRGDGTFFETIAVPGVRNAQAVAVGDFNEDDHDDLVITDGSDNVAEIYLGTGDASFVLSLSLTAFDDPEDVVAIDLNGDEHLDIITANDDSNDVSIFLGNGDATFSTLPTLATGDEPHMVVVADVDGDSLDDLIVLNRASNDVSILAGNGNGTFAAEKRFSTDLDPERDYEPRHMIVAELTDDAIVDILVSTYDNTNHIPNDSVLLRGIGVGDFVAELPGLPLGMRLREPIAHDLNDDDLADLIDTAGIAGIFTAISVGGGEFLHALQLGADDTIARAFAVEDFDGDGTSDLAYINGRGQTLVVARHNEALPGTFIVQEGLSDTLGADMLAAGDFDDDGIVDLALARQINSLTSSIWIASGLTESTFAAPVLIGQQKSTREIHALDYDDDGTLDLVGHTNFGFFRIQNIDGGNFGAINEVIPPGLLGHTADWLAIGDLDMDGFTDFAVGSVTNGGLIPDLISVWTSGGDVNLDETVFDMPGRSVGARKVLMADFNNDGFTDLAMSSMSLQASDTFNLDTLGVLPGLGDGTFGELLVSPIVPAERMLGSTDYFEHADFDGDGNEDLVRTGTGPFMSVVLGQGNGTFGAERRYSLYVNTFGDAQVLDLNGDMEPDVAVGRNSSGTAMHLHR
jgi:hypothetical protein